MEIDLLNRECRGSKETMPEQRPRWMQSTIFEASTKWIIAIFATAYLTTLLYFHHASWRDPTSMFFDRSAAYDTKYTDVRFEQSEAFIFDATRSHSAFANNSRSGSITPDICIGIPSVARAGARYLRTAVGSLLEGLTEDERARIHLKVFIANTDPTIHPAYNETWLHDLIDELLLYDLPDDELDWLDHLEGRQKGTFDYRYLLSACQNTSAPNVALIEDDVLAMDGWFQRTMSGLDGIKTKTASGGKDWLYLRLFYTEEFLGWNEEDALSRTLTSMALILAVGVTFISIRTCLPSKQRKDIPNSLLILVTCIFLPLSIVLFFKAGRLTLFPQPSSGVAPMNGYGCCSQGLVFNSEQLPSLLSWLGEAPSGLFFDMQVEKYAEENADLLNRWAIHPSVLQHLGTKSSSNETLKSERAGLVWSFEFEDWDAEQLREEREGEKEELIRT